MLPLGWRCETRRNRETSKSPLFTRWVNLHSSDLDLDDTWTCWTCWRFRRPRGAPSRRGSSGSEQAVSSCAAWGVWALPGEEWANPVICRPDRHRSMSLSTVSPDHRCCMEPWFFLTWFSVVFSATNTTERR